MKRNRTLLFILIFSVPLILVLSQCINLDKNKPDARGELYAGATTCRQCHKEIYDSYLNTAHFQGTRLATTHNVHGSFDQNANTFLFSNHMKVVMENRKDGLYQVGYVNGKITEAHRFDIAFGGVKAETYLYWKGNGLFQLPMSYFSALHSWTNSPGYDSTHIDFSRAIGRRCFECHSSYIKNLPSQTQSLQLRAEQFDKHSLILSIDCERCHGPAANHVNFHLDNPDEKKAKYIVAFKSLTRSQRIDACAVCHSGNKTMVYKTTFAFKPGNNLAQFKEPDFSPQSADPSKLDVHGNQTQMLSSSQCFIKSNMDCGTCHNTHNNERGNLVMYSQRCMTCHTEANHNFCKKAPELGEAIKNNCIDCHMPLKQSNVIAVQTSGKGNAIPYLVRNHRIAVYNDDALKIKKYLLKNTH